MSAIYVGVDTFTIAGGQAGMRVSWQAPSIRQDARANAYRIPAEQDKSLEEQGSSLYPERSKQPEQQRVVPLHQPALSLPIGPRFAYFPFGGGPRQCIGNAFALLKVRLVPATMAQSRARRLVPGHPVVPQVGLRLRSRSGLPMTLHLVHAFSETRPLFAPKMRFFSSRRD